jgi:hypothetical protein
MALGAPSASLLRAAAAHIGLRGPVPAAAAAAAAGSRRITTHLRRRLASTASATPMGAGLPVAPATPGEPASRAAGAEAGRKARAAVGQMTSTNDQDANFAVCASLAAQAGAYTRSHFHPT